MNRSYRLVGCLVLVLSPLTSLAHEKTLTLGQFNAVWTKACGKTKSLPHILTETSERYFEDSKPPYHTYISVTRYIPTDRVWVIAGRKDGALADKYEEIRIGRKSYSRDGNAPWKFQKLGFSGLYVCEPDETASTGKGTGTGVGSSDGKLDRMRFEYEYKYMGRKNSADIYVRVKRMIIPTAGSVSQTIFMYSYWINTNGVIEKSEGETRTLNTHRWDRQVREYDYSPKDLKIEAPIK